MIKFKGFRKIIVLVLAVSLVISFNGQSLIALIAAENPPLETEDYLDETDPDDGNDGEEIVSTPTEGEQEPLPTESDESLPDGEEGTSPAESSENETEDDTNLGGDSEAEDKEDLEDEDLEDEDLEDEDLEDGLETEKESDSGLTGDEGIEETNTINMTTAPMLRNFSAFSFDTERELLPMTENTRENLDIQVVGGSKVYTFHEIYPNWETGELSTDPNNFKDAAYGWDEIEGKVYPLTDGSFDQNTHALTVEYFDENGDPVSMINNVFTDSITQESYDNSTTNNYNTYYAEYTLNTPNGRTKAKREIIHCGKILDIDGNGTINLFDRSAAIAIGNNGHINVNDPLFKKAQISDIGRDRNIILWGTDLSALIYDVAVTPTKLETVIDDFIDNHTTINIEYYETETGRYVYFDNQIGSYQNFGDSEEITAREIRNFTVIGARTGSAKQGEVDDSGSETVKIPSLSKFHTVTFFVEANKYDVIFDAKGGVFDDSGEETIERKIKYSEKITEPTEPKRDHYIFDGWYTDEDYTQTWDFEAGVIEEDTTLYAKWTEEEYTLIFDANGGAFDDEGKEKIETIIKYGEKITEPTEPQLAHYNFDGWYIDKDYTQAWDFEEDVIEGDTTLYAKWTDKEYTLTYNKNDNSQNPDTALAAEGPFIKDEMVTLSTARNLGWSIIDSTFIGWSTTPNSGLDSVINGQFQMPGEDTVLYAIWREDNISQNYSLRGTNATVQVLNVNEGEYGWGEEKPTTSVTAESLLNNGVLDANALAQLFDAEIISEHGGFADGVSVRDYRIEYVSGNGALFEGDCFKEIGTFTINMSTDVDGQDAYGDFDITFVDEMTPNIKLFENEDGNPIDIMTFKLGEPLSEIGVIAAFVDMEGTKDNHTTTDELEMNVIGEFDYNLADDEQTVRIGVADLSENYSEVTVTLVFADNSDPIIRSDNLIRYPVGTSVVVTDFLSNINAKAWDINGSEKDGEDNLTDKIQVENYLNRQQFNTVGTYTVRLSVKDGDGRSANKNVIVEIYNPPTESGGGSGGSGGGGGSSDDSSESSEVSVSSEVGAVDETDVIDDATTTDEAGASTLALTLPNSAPVTGIYNDETGLWDIYDENGTPLGSVYVPVDKTLQEVLLEGELLPLGGTSGKLNPKTGESMLGIYMTVSVILLVLLTASVFIINRKRTAKILGNRQV